MKALRVFGIAFVGFLIGVSFGATFLGELPGREARLRQENDWLNKELQSARAELAKKQTP
jgi:hypothetical protein